MKRFAITLSLAAAAIFAVPSTAFAQDTPAGDHQGRPEGAHRMPPDARLHFLTEKLGLSADQQAQIKAIFEKNGPKFKEITSKGWKNLTDADKAALKDLMKSQADEINTVLTPEQQAKLKELRSREHRGPRSEESKPAVE